MPWQGGAHPALTDLCHADDQVPSSVRHQVHHRPRGTGAVKRSFPASKGRQRGTNDSFCLPPPAPLQQVAARCRERLHSRFTRASARPGRGCKHPRRWVSTPALSHKQCVPLMCCTMCFTYQNLPAHSRIWSSGHLLTCSPCLPGAHAKTRLRVGQVKVSDPHLKCVQVWRRIRRRGSRKASPRCPL